MTARIDLTGKTFGRWSVLKHERLQYWLCRCNCGTVKPVDGRALRAGSTNGCRNCRLGKPTHAESRTRLYNIWGHIISRCEDSNVPEYAAYGGRGIAICAEWRSSYEAFRDWAHANGYRADLTIDRIDNDRGYEPNNCRWATMRMQSRNRRSNCILNYQSRSYTQAELADISGLKYATFRRRIAAGWPVEKAISHPVRRKA